MPALTLCKVVSIRVILIHDARLLITFLIEKLTFITARAADGGDIRGSKGITESEGASTYAVHR
jgi:hypothetical protein